MFSLNILKGVVVNNNDPDQLGRLQIRVLPELKDVADDLLPWMRPFMYQDMSHDIPEIDTPIFCFFMDSHWQRGYWITCQHIDGFYDYIDGVSFIDRISEIDNQAYPEPVFRKFSDNTILFHNTLTRDTGIYSPSGSYAIINYQGSLILSATNNKITVSQSEIIAETKNIFSIASFDKKSSIIFDVANKLISVTSSNVLSFISKSITTQSTSKQETIGSVLNNYTSLTNRITGQKIDSIGGNYFVSVSGDLQTTTIGAYNIQVAGLSGIQFNSVFATSFKALTMISLNAPIINIGGGIVNLG